MQHDLFLSSSHQVFLLDCLCCTMCILQIFINKNCLCVTVLNRLSYEGRLPLTSWWRKSSDMTVGQSSLIYLAHLIYLALRLTSRKPLWLDLQPVDIKSRWRHNWKSAQVVNSHLVSDPHNPATRFRPPSATVVSAEPFLHGTRTLRCLQKEMATIRH